MLRLTSRCIHSYVRAALATMRVAAFHVLCATVPKESRMMLPTRSVARAVWHVATGRSTPSTRLMASCVRAALKHAAATNPRNPNSHRVATVLQLPVARLGLNPALFILIRLRIHRQLPTSRLSRSQLQRSLSHPSAATPSRFQRRRIRNLKLF